MNPQPNPFDAYYLDVLKKKYALFTGRARRSEYWYFTLFNFLISIGLSMVDTFTGLGFLNPVYGLLVLIPAIAVAIRRLHDTGRSGWWLLIVFVPFVGWIILIYFFILDSQPFDNQYGPHPKKSQIII